MFINNFIGGGLVQVTNSRGTCQPNQSLKLTVRARVLLAFLS